MNDIVHGLLIVLLLLLANGIFAMAEIALISARKSRLEELADEGDKRAAAALKMTRDPNRFLSIVQVGITLVGVLSGVFGGGILADALAPRFEPLPVIGDYAHPIAVGLVVMVITFASIVIGELVPKRLALINPVRVARLLVGPMRWFYLIVKPFVHLLMAGTDGLMKLLRVPPQQEPPITEEEVNILIQQGMVAGVFNKTETEMVAGVLELDQLSVTSIMTPRPKIVFLNIDDPEELNARKIVASGHSHFPVFQSNRDQVVGMVAVKAIWANSAFGLPTSLRSLMAPPVIVPETMMASQLLEQFRKTGQHIALIADEFGAIQGLVTLIDVLEAIMGDMPERGHRISPQIRARDDGSWLVDATLPVEDLKTHLDVDELPHEEEAEYQTLGGFLMTQFGRIPKVGDRFELNGWTFEISAMDRHRVDKVIMTKPVVKEGDDDAEQATA